MLHDLYSRRTLAHVGVPGFVVCLLLAGGGTGWAEQGPKDFFFYYSDNQQIGLTLSRRQVALRLLPGASWSFAESFPAQIDPSRRRVLSLNGLTLLDLRHGLPAAEVSALLSRLETVPEVELVAPVFESPGALMIVTDEFVASFSAELSEGEIDRLNEQYGVERVRRIAGDGNTWVLRVSNGNALKTANAYHLLPAVIYAHPDFVRVMNRSPVKGIGPDETLIFDPTGQQLPPDTLIEKGTSGFRATQPSEVVLPDLDSGITLPEPKVPVTRAIIKSEGFEGSFPNAWTLYGSPTWAATSYRSYAGSWSGYCVGSSVSAPGPYPNNASAWMVYGPFSLADAQDARVDLQAWVRTESGFDYLGVFASINGSNFYGRTWSGDWATAAGGSGWMNIGFDLTRVFTLGDLRGQPQVWVALYFSSDFSITYEGAYADQVVVEKVTGGYQSLTSDIYDHLQWSLNNNEQLWGVNEIDIDAPEAWSITTGNNAITVAIIDEGVDLTHPDLASKLVPGYDATGLGSGGGPSGNDAHGTNCAGITAAVTGNSLGVGGVDQQAKIMPVRIAYSSGGSWVTSDSWIADGINWAVTNGADVLSNSWGGGSPSAAITNAIANAKTNGRGGKGSVVVFASGNDNGPVIYPATLSTVLAIGALSPCGERKAPTSCDGEYWWGSNFGAQLDLIAPGVHMYSTDIQGAAGYDPGNYFYNFNGTSSATPTAAGVAALVLGFNPNLTATQVENQLTSTAQDLGAPGWDQFTGWGLVNAYEALVSLAPEVDWGDAPDPSYPTLAASNGANHTLAGPFLGSTVDAEADGQPTANANGDDLGGTDDEDGVVFTSALERWKNASLTVTASASGVLNAWLDFNQDGDWLDAGEQIFTNVALAAGANPLAFAVPGGATPGTTYARFRFSSASGLAPTGAAPDGEVEDYKVTVVTPTDLTISNMAVTSTTTYEACNSITLGPNFNLTTPGHLTLRAGVVVKMNPTVSVQTGCVLDVKIETPIGCP